MPTRGARKLPAYTARAPRTIDIRSLQSHYNLGLSLKTGETHASHGLLLVFGSDHNTPRAGPRNQAKSNRLYRNTIIVVVIGIIIVSGLKAKQA